MITRKRKIDFSDESVQLLMQETYHEIVDQRSRALTSYKKVTKNMDENIDIAMIGKVANDLLKIIDSSLDKKIQLLKIQAGVLYKSGKIVDEPTVNNNGKITAEDRKMIQEMLKQTTDEDELIKKYN